jgi:hypothetical protein
MALPATRDDLKSIHKEILSFLWTKTVSAETVQKRRLVARKRLAPSFGNGSLQIQHTEETEEGLRIKLIQKHHWKLEQVNNTKFTQIIKRLLCQIG